MIPVKQLQMSALGWTLAVVAGVTLAPSSVAADQIPQGW